MSESTEEDRRQFERVPFESSVELVQGTKLYRTELKDVSLNGALIEAPEAWHDNKKTVEVRIHLTDNSPTREIRMTGEVVHETDGDLGFECNKITSDALAELKRLLEFHLGPGQVQREIGDLIDKSP